MESCCVCLEDKVVLAEAPVCSHKMCFSCLRRMAHRHIEKNYGLYHQRPHWCFTNISCPLCRRDIEVERVTVFDPYQASYDVLREEPEPYHFALLAFMTIKRCTMVDGACATVDNVTIDDVDDVVEVDDEDDDDDEACGYLPDEDPRYEMGLMMHQPSQSPPQSSHTFLRSAFCKNPQVFIKNMSGRTFTVPIRGDQTVWNLKEMCEMESGVPAVQSRLIFAGRQLADNQSLRSYNIWDGCTIIMVQSMRGD